MFNDKYFHFFCVKIVYLGEGRLGCTTTFFALGGLACCLLGVSVKVLAALGNPTLSGIVGPDTASEIVYRNVSN